MKRKPPLLKIFLCVLAFIGMSFIPLITKGDIIVLHVWGVYFAFFLALAVPDMHSMEWEWILVGLIIIGCHIGISWLLGSRIVRLFTNYPENRKTKCKKPNADEARKELPSEEKDMLKKFCSTWTAEKLVAASTANRHEYTHEALVLIEKELEQRKPESQDAQCASRGPR